MLKRLIKYSVLLLVMLNLPGWILVKISPVISSFLSILSFILMVWYLALAKKWSLNGWMLLLGCLYYLIGTLIDQTYIPENRAFLVSIIKYFIIVLGGYAIVKDTSKKELFFFTIAGAASVFLQIFFFYNPVTDGDRFSGFYLNPNSLGFICLMGYALTYGLESRLRIIGQIVFTAIGFLTFSRTFIVLWLFMNVLSLRLSIKNIRILGIGLALFIGLLTYNSFLPRSNARLKAMTRILEGTSDNTSELEADGRSETWAVYYPALFSQPIFGHGHGAFRGGAKIYPYGPHNAYIKVWGEGGIFTLLVMVLLYGLLLKESWVLFLRLPFLFLMMIALCLFMSTNHNYFDSPYLLFFSMWLQYQIFVKSRDRTENTVSENLELS